MDLCYNLYESGKIGLTECFGWAQTQDVDELLIWMVLFPILLGMA